MQHIAEIFTCLIGEKIGTFLGTGFDFGLIARQLLIDGRPVHTIGEMPAKLDDRSPYLAFHLVRSITPAAGGAQRHSPFSRPLDQDIPIDLKIGMTFVIFGFEAFTEVDAWGIISVFNQNNLEKKDPTTGATLASGKVSFKDASPDLITILTELGMMQDFSQIQAKQQHITAMRINYEIEATVCDFCIDVS